MRATQRYCDVKQNCVLIHWTMINRRTYELFLFKGILKLMRIYYRQKLLKKIYLHFCPDENKIVHPYFSPDEIRAVNMNIKMSIVDLYLLQTKTSIAYYRACLKVQGFKILCIKRIQIIKSRRLDADIKYLFCVIVHGKYLDRVLITHALLHYTEL